MADDVDAFVISRAFRATAQDTGDRVSEPVSEDAELFALLEQRLNTLADGAAPSGMADVMAFAIVMVSGSMPNVCEPNQLPVRLEATDDLVGDHHDVVAPQHLLDFSKYVRGGMTPPAPMTGLAMKAAMVRGLRAGSVLEIIGKARGILFLALRLPPHTASIVTVRVQHTLHRVEVRVEDWQASEAPAAIVTPW